MHRPGISSGFHTVPLSSAFASSGIDAGATIDAAALVEKRRPRDVDLRPDFIGLDVPDRYVFGFGMDYKGYWRNAAGIFAAVDD